MPFQINKYVDQFNWNKQSILNESEVVKRNDKTARIKHIICYVLDWIILIPLDNLFWPLYDYFA
jgi:hypothetical protein